MMENQDASPAFIEAMTQLVKTVHCPVCMDYIASPVSLPCSHTYCQECIDEVIKNSEKCYCPLCQKAFTKKNMSSVSKTLMPVISSIKDFMACFEGKPISTTTTASTIDDPLHADKKFRMLRPDFKGGDLVHVAPRLWPGINKPGGSAWIQSVIEPAEHEAAEGICYDCKYVLGGGVDFRVPAAYIRVANDLHEERESRSRRTRPQGSTSSKSSKISTSVKSKNKIVSSMSTGSKRKANQQNESPLRSNNDKEDESLENPPLVFLCSTLSAEELSQVNQFCAQFTSATVHDSYSEAVTHVIVHAERKGKGKSQVRILRNRTMKYLQGVLGEQSADFSFVVLLGLGKQRTHFVNFNVSLNRAQVDCV
jgi:hypothetical protein